MEPRLPEVMVIGCAAPDPRAQTPAKKVRFGVDRVFWTVRGLSLQGPRPAPSRRLTTNSRPSGLWTRARGILTTGRQRCLRRADGVSGRDTFPVRRSEEH